MIVGQEPIGLAVGASGGCLDSFTRIYPISSLSSCHWETSRYRQKYCLKGPLNPKQPTSQSIGGCQLGGGGGGVEGEPGCVKLCHADMHSNSVSPFVISGLPRSGKKVWKTFFFQVREKSGKFRKNGKSQGISKFPFKWYG